MAHSKTSAQPNDFILPDLGEGVHEAELIKWRVKVGDTVAEHDILAEMETDKALVEVPSPRPGRIAALHGKEGDILKVGSPLVTYEGSPTSGAGSPTAPPGQPAAGRADAHEDQGTPNGTERDEDAGTVVGISPGAPGRALATPAVRRLARDLGVDIDTVRGSGIGGRVTDKDVRAAARGSDDSRQPRVPDDAGHRPETRDGAQPVTPRSRRPLPPAAPAPVPTTGHRPSPAPAASRGAEAVRIPFRGVRRTIAGRLRESVDRAVHFNVMDEADVTELDALRRRLAAASGEKVSFLPFVSSAVCRVLTDERFRALNATVEESTGPEGDAFIVQHRAVHLGIATDTDTGLMVPVIRDCDALGVLEIGREIAGIAAAARDRSIARDRLLGSTFTISNVGSHAGRFATPIINYPEVAILAVGRARQGAVVRTIGSAPGLFVGTLLPLSLACDHRVVDGATGALALAEVVRLLQDPEQLLAPSRVSHR